MLKPDKSVYLDAYDVSHWIGLNGKINIEEFCSHFVSGITEEAAKQKWERCMEFLRQDLGVEVKRDRYFNYKFDAWPVKNRISDLLDEIALTEDPDAPEKGL